MFSFPTFPCALIRDGGNRQQLEEIPRLLVVLHPTRIALTCELLKEIAKKK